MGKIDKTVLRETGYVALFTVILSVLMQSVFLIIGKWDVTVLFGNLLGIVAGVGNFFLMGLTVQRAMGRAENEIKNYVRLSQMGRMFMLFAIVLIGYLLRFFNIIAVVIPLLFPRFSITIRQLLINKQR